MDFFHRKRHRLVRALPGVLALAAALPAGAQTAVKLSLDGRFEGPVAPFLVAQDKGYYRNEGIAVTIDEAASALDPITRVASGSHEMGFADINMLIRYRDQNPSAQIKAVFMVYNRPPYAVLARKSRGVSEPKQLEGKKLGASPAGSTFGQWPLFARLNLTDAEYGLYEKVYSHLKPQTPTPDLVIYLQAPVETLIERVHRRGVNFERRISAQYLSRLADAYSRYFYSYEAAPLLIVNSERLNFVDDEDHVKLLQSRITSMRGRREFFNLSS